MFRYIVESDFDSNGGCSVLVKSESHKSIPDCIAAMKGYAELLKQELVQGNFGEAANISVSFGKERNQGFKIQILAIAESDEKILEKIIIRIHKIKVWKRNKSIEKKIDSAWQNVMKANAEEPYNHEKYEMARRVFEAWLMIYTNGDKDFAYVLDQCFLDSMESMDWYMGKYGYEDLMEQFG